MKIGIVLTVTPGYSETFFTSKIRGLQAQGHNVVVLASKKVKGFDLCKVKLAPTVYTYSIVQLVMMALRFCILIPYYRKVQTFVRLERERGTSTSNILKRIYLNAHIFPQGLDWLHFGFATQAIDKELVAKSIKAKMGVSLRGFDINVYPLKHPECYRTLWQQVDKVHSISKYLLERAYHLGLDKTVPATIITPAVMTKELPSYREPKATDYHPLKIVTVARLTWIKGVDIAIEAMKILKEHGVNFTYSIIGDGSAKEMERYQFMVHEYDLDKQVVFCGKLTHKETLNKLQEANIYVQSSLNEGFCNAVLEAQAMGKLVVASRAGALPENVLDGITGWLFSKGDFNALAQQIIAITNLPEEEKKKISKAARARVLQDFTMEQQQQKFVEFYTQLP